MGVNQTCFAFANSRKKLGIYDMPDYPQLYRVTSTFQKVYMESSGYFVAYQSEGDVNFQSEGKGYIVKNLRVIWFYGTKIEKRFSDEIYRRVFSDFTEDNGPTSTSYSAIDELFTRNQARNLSKYLASSFENKNVNHEIDQVDFPLEPNQTGISDVPVGGMRDLWMLSEIDEYPLGFNVWGFYDLSQHEKSKGITEN